ncbi:hypothetical protein JCM14244_06190 [Venenivibrio stagnispumantis]|uniref:EAL domain, c-di-GMP-specific phosphodiesterase class I (Or its enzymatically inactive variant) n=1 Tax=Venenivibrio stagnispumantis TaxID=407998 RepID=A0AA46ACP3_9AQUI|nr:EAL domain-containing protein [Venenivibrio stagnispumantis]MCW4572563.1 EAL domain-containing protein [Venenivibrio stagnispumantis]SMP00357.1 EAL domain, c-di-GMP-specific phosphodiesterase class I (or its enzymatically inactive variant) [Venenivibrio stagnispumantis]
MTKKNENREAEILDTLKNVFVEFYNFIHEDEHASSFFSSFNQIEFLIERQSFFLLNAIEALEESKNEEVKRELYKLAERHFKLGISPKSIFDFINLYINLLNEKKINVDESVINTMENMLKETTAKTYIKEYINEIIDFLNKEKELKNTNKYDDYFYENVLNYLKQIKELVDETNKNFDKLSLFTHTICNVFKLENSIAFKVMFYGKEEQLLEFKSIHKKIHEYTRDIISYLVNGKYKESVILTSEMLFYLYKLIYTYSDISLRWRDNKKSILSEYIYSQKNNLKTYLLIIETKKDILIGNDIKKVIFNYLENYFIDFQFIIFDEIDGNINILINQEDYYFNLKLDNLLKGFKNIADYLKEKYISITEKPIIRIGRIDLSTLKMYSLNKEEISEIINLIRDILEKEKSDDIILIVDYNTQINKIISAVYENLEIKRIALNQLKKEEIDLFVHKIFDLTGKEFALEILARIKNPSDKKYIPAGKFLRVFEEKGLMGEFDRVILKKLRENIKDIKKISKNIFVNIYPTSLSYEPVVKEIEQVVNVFKEENLNLFLEITEYAIVSNKEIFNHLENKDLFIAFDDFGTGYTNYEIVGELGEKNRAKVIKIDGSIVKRMVESKIYESMVESITLFSNKVGMSTVYEFIENEEILNKIKEIAKYLKLNPENLLLQGFYLHVPTYYKDEIKA